AGVDRRGRRPVRLLPGGPDHERGSAARTEPAADGRRQRRGDGPPPVPLRDLHPYPQGHTPRRGIDREGGTVMQKRPIPVDPYLPEFMQEEMARAAALPHVSRRGFIKLSGVVGGGLVLGFTLGPVARAAAQGGRGADVFAPNAYVQVRPDGVIILYAKNPEVGQGGKTALPMIVAEELDADWSQVRVEQSAINEALYGRQVAGGSRSIPTSWEPLRRAGAVARAMLVRAGAETLGVDASELVTEAGYVIHR